MAESAMQPTSSARALPYITLDINTTSANTVMSSLVEQLDVHFSDDILLTLARTIRKKRLNLLSIPAEIRNRIIDDALLEADPIIITAQAPQQPPVLQVCRQLRREYLQYYYSANRFSLRLRDYNIVPLLPRYLLVLKYRAPSLPMAIVIQGITVSGPPNWDNLKIWGSFVHRSKDIVVPSGAAPGSHIHFREACTVLDTARKLNTLSWEEVEQILENMREVMLLHSTAWA